MTKNMVKLMYQLVEKTTKIMMKWRVIRDEREGDGRKKKMTGWEETKRVAR